MNKYVSRALHFLNDKGERETICDRALLTMGKSIVVLGEPGMGKTRLLQMLGEEMQSRVLTAATFVNHPKPAHLVQKGLPLILDGLDELIAAQESDPVNRVLGKLIEAGSPPFILSCRAADWRGAAARQDLSTAYGTAPVEMTLLPLPREGAVEFLMLSLESVRAENVISYLDARGIPDLYGNPLTLDLFSEIAKEDRPLPDSRAELMLRAIQNMWPELGDRHDHASLSELDEETALRAAGAICAAYILTGSESVMARRTRAGESRALVVTDLQSLPGGSDAPKLLKSRLFRRIPGQDHTFKPLHRSIAEFLGARWLIASAQDELARERILSMLTLDGGVPASLRGIHAWLLQDKQLAPHVIKADPYGVLRYGDADGLDVEQGRQLLHALKKLQETNPFFRSEDWQRHSAKGLTQPELRDDVREIILAESTTFHLRSLLLQIVQGSRLAPALADDLRGIMLQSGRKRYSYAERRDAALAVAALEIRHSDWQSIIKTLSTSSDTSSGRLAIDMMAELGFARFPADLIAQAVLAYLGLVKTNTKGKRVQIRAVGTLSQVARGLPDDFVAPVLDQLVVQKPKAERDEEKDFHGEYEFQRLVVQLIARQIQLDVPEPLRLLGWLRLFAESSRRTDDDSGTLTAFLEQNHKLRRAIQQHVVFVEGKGQDAWRRIWRLDDLHRGLSLSRDDLIFFLREMTEKAAISDEDIEVWRYLLHLARTTDGLPDDVVAAARPFVQNRCDLEQYLSELIAPPPEPEWKINEDRRLRRAEQQKARAWQKHRQQFSENEAALRSGELRWCLGPAQCYLGLFNDTNLDLSPPDRIAQWLGDGLRDAALSGFEAALHHAERPSAQKVAESYAKSQRWNFIYPMIAGVVERIRLGRDLGDLSDDTIIAVRIGLLEELLGDRINEQAVLDRLDTFLRQDAARHERYLRLLIEPSLNGRKTHVSGLYSLVRNTTDRELAIKLSKEWLDRYSDLPARIELELIDVLYWAGEFEALRRIAARRDEQGYQNVEQRRNWQALAIIIDFPASTAKLGTIPDAERDLLWHLRHRLTGEENNERLRSAGDTRLLAWIVGQFRRLWPWTGHPIGVSSGDTNAWDATEFLGQIINRMAPDVSDDATTALAHLAAGERDGYTDYLLYALSQQRQARREQSFSGVTVERLKAVVTAQLPATSEDLLTVVRNALKRLQRELRGNDTDSIRKYWRGEGQPHNEDECTKALVEDLQHLLPGIGRTLQAYMPNDKVADILFTVGNAALPVECKGQWNRDLWSASAEQLDALYLRDWRSQDRGLYLVYWFGKNVAPKFRLKLPPDGKRPTTPEELRERLYESVPLARHHNITIEVVDLTR